MATANKTEKIEHVSLSEIEVLPSWNARLVVGEDEASGGPDQEDAAFAGLVASIGEKGQDTPVILRAQTKGRKPYFLVAGFRRFAAIAKIAETTGVKNPTIRAEIKTLTDVEAREINLRENTARDGLSGPDLCCGIGQLLENNPKLTSVAAANMLGMNQSYVAKLIRIWSKVPKGIVKHWRESTLKIKVDDMAAISELPKGEMQGKYDELCAGKEKGGARGKNAWVETAQKKAVEIGAMLGKLSRNGAIELVGNDFFGDNVRTLVSFKSTATEAQVAKIAGAAEKSFSVALETEDEPHGDKAKDASKDPAAAAKRNRKNGAAAAVSDA